MIKRVVTALCVALSALSAQARISAFGLPAEFGISPDPENWYEINPYTWDTFTTFDSDIIFGKGKSSRTVLQAEYYSAMVIEGHQVAQNTFVASFSDRRGFFGGDGYLDLYYIMPTNSNYAQQAVIYGGWKYNLMKYLDIDLGGNIIYANKKVVGPGLVGNLSGQSWRGDIYCGFSCDEVFVNPFAYVSYEPTYDALKFHAGFSPKLNLEPYTAIEGLGLETQAFVGYIDAKRWSGDDKINGNYWNNSYGYLQLEANLVYEINSYRLFVGVGWAITNDETVGPNSFDMGPSDMVWGSCGVGYVF